ncbi:hypothetical protein [Bdellovibrio sp. NC01]|uniref:hypothetical protein n=1 Tax=Bdellovibrio sp. NC01 TaxID=2220073 RepID=UPI001158310A|nr:hypothetical protein [Bdellovibrio sp. NC01]QDK36244.1 hypothetical protein DOE51_00845 [Bdellovibrio sp. NC01]
MLIRCYFAALFAAFTFILSGCGNNLVPADFASSGPASSEEEYKVAATPVSDPLAVQMAAKFLYRPLIFNSASPYALGSGLRGVVPANSAIAIPFAEFRVFNSSGAQVQQGETDTNGYANFNLPKTAGTYTLKVYSRALNSYVRVSVLEDTYANAPYSISKDFTVSASDITTGTLDLRSTPVYAEADENISAKIEGGAFNIMFDVLLANEYIRREIGKDTLVSGSPSPLESEWWVADKVTVYWKKGFNPRTYFSNDGAALSFYGVGTGKLYILGGLNGDVKASDTDHFDDSVILHEYAHFLEDRYGNTGSPGGSHNGNFIIDPRLAWSEGWANYFQAAVLTGAANVGSEDHLPADARDRFYLDTVGYNTNSSDTTGSISIAFNLTALPSDSSTVDNPSADAEDTGIFRELSISRTLYKSTRATTEAYGTSKYGGGISFKNIWKTFSGEDKVGGTTRSMPASSSLRKSSTYPIANMGLFNYLLNINVGSPDAKWTSILTEERQKKVTTEYAAYIDTVATGVCSWGFTHAATEQSFASIPRSNQQNNNDFFLYYHNASTSENLVLDYARAGAVDLDLDLIVYPQDYLYFEDYYRGKISTTDYIAKESRRIASLDSSTESVSMAGLASGWYVINVKVNAYNKTSANLNGTATYTLKKDGITLCAKER